MSFAENQVFLLNLISSDFLGEAPWRPEPCVKLLLDPPATARRWWRLQAEPPVTGSECCCCCCCFQNTLGLLAGLHSSEAPSLTVCNLQSFSRIPSTCLQEPGGTLGSPQSPSAFLLCSEDT